MWLAQDERTAREVAVKIVPREGKSGERARREAQAMAKLDHPRCLRAFACGRDAENVYIVYAYVPGRTFRECLRAGSATDADAIEVAAQVLDGLAHAHECGIVHRDVKPANVLLADEGDGISVRILDFGLARFADGETLTAAGDVPGTLAYIAPERLHGEPAGAAGDVWSVGVLLYEALAGRHPFWRSSLAETADAIAQGPPPLRTERPDLPDALLSTVDRALALDPAKRPSAAKLARLLRRARGDRDGTTLSRARSSSSGRCVAPVLAGVYAGVGASLLPFYPAHAAPVLAVARGGADVLRSALGRRLRTRAADLPARQRRARARAHLRSRRARLVRPELPRARADAAAGARAAPRPARARARAGRLREDESQRSCARLGAATAIVLAAVVHGVRAGPIGLGIPESRDPVAAANVLVRAAPHSLVYVLPAVAFAALVLPWVVRRVQQLSRRAAEARTYTG